MSKPFHNASGTLAATTTTTLSVVAPTISVGDLLIANLMTNDNTAISGQDGRWLAIAAATNNTAAMRYTTFYLPNALSTDSGATFNFTIAGTTAGFGVISAYSNAALKQPAGSSISSNASSATVTWATLADTHADSIMVAMFGYLLNGATDGGISAGAGTFVNRYFQTSATGVTASMGLYDASNIGAGQLTGSRTMATGAVAAVNSGVMFEIVGNPNMAGGNLGGSVLYPAVDRSTFRPN